MTSLTPHCGYCGIADGVNNPAGLKVDKSLRHRASLENKQSIGMFIQGAQGADRSARLG